MNTDSREAQDPATRVALIEHLSSEITTQVEAMVHWRGRMNFTAYFGPWIVFAAYFGIKEVQPKWPESTGSQALIGVLALVMACLYLAFGHACALVEVHFWEYCNRMRALIASLHTDSKTKIDGASMHFSHDLRWTYFKVYLLMLATFVVGATLLTKLTPPSSNQKLAADAASSPSTTAHPPR